MDASLTHGERIRIEALKQANARQSSFDNTDTIIARAKTYEAFIKGEDN